MSNVMYNTCFWNNLQQVYAQSRMIGEANIHTSFRSISRKQNV